MVKRYVLIDSYHESGKWTRRIEEGENGCFVLYDDYEKFKTEVEHLEREKAEWRKAATKLEAENRHLRAKNSQLDWEHKECNKHIKELEKKLAETQEKFSDAKIKLAHATSELARLREEAGIHQIAWDACQKLIEWQANELEAHKSAVECHDRLQEIINEQNAQFKALKEAVPGEVEKAIGRVQRESYEGGRRGYPEPSKEVEKLISLISSLIETNKEKLRGMLKEAWIAGAINYIEHHSQVGGMEDSAKSYVQKKIEEMEE